MIVFDLACGPAGHRFEGWFASTLAFEEQVERALVTCPQCGSADVIKTVTAPSLGRKGNQSAPASARNLPVSGGKVNPAAQEITAKMVVMQAQALQQSTWVGDQFAAHSRAMHYGESDQTTIHGEATLAEASELIEEGIAIVPLPFPVAPPDKIN